MFTPTITRKATTGIAIPVRFAPAVRIRFTVATLLPGTALTSPGTKMSGGLCLVSRGAATSPGGTPSPAARASARRLTRAAATTLPQPRGDVPTIGRPSDCVNAIRTAGSNRNHE